MGVNRRLRTDSHRNRRPSGRAETHSHHRLSEMEAQSKAVDIRIQTVKKVIAATKGFAKELQALGLPKEDAAKLALDLFEFSLNDEDGHGGH